MSKFYYTTKHEAVAYLFGLGYVEVPDLFGDLSGSEFETTDPETGDLVSASVYERVGDPRFEIVFNDDLLPDARTDADVEAENEAYFEDLIARTDDPGVIARLRTMMNEEVENV